MNKLFQLLVRYQNLILFLFLQLIALFWLFRTNKFHAASYYNAAQIVAANTGEVTTNVTDYFRLKEINDNLSKRILELENENGRSFQSVYKPTNSVVIDSTKYKRKWKYYSSKIINKSTRLIDNYITIDRGSNSGVHRDMGVVNGQQVIGVVKKTSDNYALIIPLINSQLKIGAKLKKTNHLGIVEWNKKDLYKTSLVNIPAFVPVAIGDTVVTSGYSSYFPEGMLIGTISKIKTLEASNNVWLELLLFTDFKSVSYVQVVENILQEEQFQLEKNVYE